MERISSVFPLPTLVTMLFCSYRFMFHTFLGTWVDKIHHFRSFMLATYKHFLLSFWLFPSFFKFEDFHLVEGRSCFLFQSIFWKYWSDFLTQLDRIQIVCFERINFLLRIYLYSGLSIVQASSKNFQHPLSKKLYCLIDNYRARKRYQ